VTRKCGTCQHVKRAEIDRRLAAGEPGSQIARDYDLNPSSLHRHRVNCLGLSSSNAIMKEVARDTAAVACLPSKNNLSEVAYRIDPALWVRKVLGVEPTKWQEEFLRAPRGASILALTARQCGKTTTAAWAMAHAALFFPGSLSVVACPAQRQSAEAVRRVREAIIKAGGKLVADNVYGLELTNGSRVLALPGSDDSIRGLTVDAWIVADEAARLSDDLIAALRPMRARRPDARFAMLSTAWSRTDPFWMAWAGDDPSWIRLKATADTVHYDPKFLEQERRSLGEDAFKREYFGVPLGVYERATQVHVPLVPPGPAFGPPVQERGVPIANPFKSLGGRQ